MPLYSYHCPKCDKDMELLTGFSSTAACPTCGSQNLERLMSRVATPSKTGEMLKSARSQAAREGHFSNYSRGERRG